MTPKSQDQIAAELYPTIPTAIVHYDYNDIVEYQREAWQEGLQVGAELLDWAAENALCKRLNGQFIWMLKRDIYKEYTTAELLEIFLKEKYGK